MQHKGKDCLEACLEGVRCYIHVTPRSGKEVIEGLVIENGAAMLKVRIRELPEKGKANQALIKYIAKEIGVAPSLIRLESGENSRRKTLLITGDKALIKKVLLWGEQFSQGLLTK